MRRIKSLDSFRGLVISFMLIGHYAPSWMTLETFISYFSNVNLVLGFIGIPIFWTIVGISFSLSKERRKLQGDFKKHIYKRGLILICLNFLLNIIFSFKQVWTYEVLVPIGISQIVCYHLREKSNPFKIFVIFLIILSVPFLRDYFNYQIELFTIVNPIWDFGTFFRGMIVNMPFAVFPYISYMILGTIIGDELVKVKFDKNMGVKFCHKLLIYGVISLLIGLSFSIFNLPIRQRYEEGLHILITTGIVMFIFSGLYWLEDVQARNIFHVLTYYGQIALTFLFLHYFINVYIFNYIFEVSQNLSIYPSLILIIFICLVLWIMAKIWARYNYKFSLDWIVRKLS
ncbi:MAG: DUF418 domain-containing protein [Candidatus Helarchaeota archaeon]|nr:DUF418 domain-containing protein [Candidatus Helarchaeota archaeon]